MLDEIYFVFNPDDALEGSADVLKCLSEMLNVFSKYVLQGESPMPEAIDAIINILEKEKKLYMYSHVLPC